MTFEEWLMDSGLAEGIIASSGMLALMLVALFLYNSIRKSRITDRRAHLELDLLRLQLEREVYKSTKGLTSDPKNFEDVNHLVMDSTEAVLDSGNRSSFFSSLGIDFKTMNVLKGTAFVLTPHHPDFDQAYQIIKKTTEALGFKVERGDEKFTEGPILRHVLKKIVTSELILANIDGRNPNVFYELGLAQSLGKRVIILTSEVESAPFDVRDQRMVVWSNAQELELALTRAIAVP